MGWLAGVASGSVDNEICIALGQPRLLLHGSCRRMLVEPGRRQAECPTARPDWLVPGRRMDGDAMRAPYLYYVHTHWDSAGPSNLPLLFAVPCQGNSAKAYPS